MAALSAPEPLAPDHELDDFDSGIAALDDWLKRRARSDESGCLAHLRDLQRAAGRRVLQSGGRVSHAQRRDLEGSPQHA